MPGAIYQLPPKSPQVAAAPPAAPPDDGLKQIYDELKTEIESLINTFWEKIQGEIASAGAHTGPGDPSRINSPSLGASQNLPKYKNLPWFQHGMRGFLQKLWYGDHPENPTWNGIQKEHVSLDRYHVIKEDLEVFFTENMGIPANNVSDLISQIMTSVMSKLTKAYSLGQTHNPQQLPQAKVEEPALPVEPVKKRGRRPNSSKPMPMAAAMGKKAPLPEPSVPSKPEAEPEPELEKTPEEMNVAGSVLDALSHNDTEAITRIFQDAGVSISPKQGVNRVGAAKIVLKTIHELGTNKSTGIPQDAWLSWSKDDFQKNLGFPITKAALIMARNDIASEMPQIQSDPSMSSADIFGEPVTPGVGESLIAIKNRYKQLLKETKYKPIVQKV